MEQTTVPPVLDACCGSRMFWFDRQDDRALFVDKRRETLQVDIGTHGTRGRLQIVIDPDHIADFSALPYPHDTFALVVFDPPHIRRSAAKGLITKKYGCLNGEWREMLSKGFSECFRVLRPQGTLIFKWSETEIRLSDVLALTPERPLFGHRSGKKQNTHWVAFLKDRKGEWETGLYPGKITAHWLRAAFDRIAAGETELEVMADYGYERTSGGGKSL